MDSSPVIQRTATRPPRLVPPSHSTDTVARPANGHASARQSAAPKGLLHPRHPPPRRLSGCKKLIIFQSYERIVAFLRTAVHRKTSLERVLQKRLHSVHRFAAMKRMRANGSSYGDAQGMKGIPGQDAAIYG